METGSTSAQDEVEDLEQDNLVRHRSKRKSSGFVEPTVVEEVVDVSTASSPKHQDTSNNPQHNGNVFHSDEVSNLACPVFTINLLHCSNKRFIILAVAL